MVFLKIGIYGGSFNPPHWGHLRGAVYAREALGLDQLLLVPAGDPPHKALAKGSPTPDQRLKLLKLAVRELPGLEIWDYELRKQGKSYTVETLQVLRQLRPEDELTLIMGTDMYLSFPTWRQPEAIAHMAGLAVLYRGEDGEEAALEHQLRTCGYPAVLLKNRVTDISSTQLRSLLRLGGAEEYLPRAALDYIRDQGLYCLDEDLRRLPLARLEEAVKDFLKPRRVPHVLGCRDTALELGRIHGADPVILARSALLHDITKLLDGPTQLTLAKAYGMIIDNSEPEQTLHALTGAEAARRIFGESEAVCACIAGHTTGHPGMSPEAQILNLADAIEPTRAYPGVEELRELARESIPRALEASLSRTLDHIACKGLTPDSMTVRTLAWLRKEYAL